MFALKGLLCLEHFVRIQQDHCCLFSSLSAAGPGSADRRLENHGTPVYIYGIGLHTSREILKKADVDPDIRVKDLTEEDAGKIRRVIDADYMVEGDLRREVSLNIKRLMEIGSYRGIRHRRGLPVRGQKTKTNARTRKGPKRLAGKKR